jgi:hypothetical protein
MIQVYFEPAYCYDKPSLSECTLISKPMHKSSALQFAKRYKQKNSDLFKFQAHPIGYICAHLILIDNNNVIYKTL